MEDVEPEVEQAARHGRAVDQDVPLDQVPPAGADQQGRHDLVQAIDPAVRVPVLDRPRDRVEEVDLALDHVPPGRRVRVLEVRHEDVRAGVERVDDHLPLGRARELDPPALEILGGRRDRPGARADLTGLGQEVQPAAGVERRLTLGAAPEERGARRAEVPLEPGHERERVGRQDLAEPALDRAPKLDAVSSHHVRVPSPMCDRAGSTRPAIGWPPGGARHRTTR